VADSKEQNEDHPGELKIFLILDYKIKEVSGKNGTVADHGNKSSNEWWFENVAENNHLRQGEGDGVS